MRPGVPAVPRPIRSAAASLAQALANDGIRRLGITWTLGIAADGALVVVTIVTVFNRGGVIAAAAVGGAAGAGGGVAAATAFLPFFVADGFALIESSLSSALAM